LFALADALHGASDESIRAALASRLGADPFASLAAVGQVRASRHVAPGADPERVARALEEELDRHAAMADRAAETREAMAAITATASEALTARLREAADALHEVGARALAESAVAEEAEHRQFVGFLEDLEAQHAARKPRAR
jgi:hypothetical protein